MTPDAGSPINFADLFASIDAQDTERFLSFIAKNGTFRFGSWPPVTGHEGIRPAIENFFASISALQHTLHRVIGDGMDVACEGEVTYTRHDGSTITLPFANVFTINAGLISVYSVYIDIGPLYNG